jgi:hypothetical protein
VHSLVGLSLLCSVKVYSYSCRILLAKPASSPTPLQSFYQQKARYVNGIYPQTKNSQLLALSAFNHQSLPGPIWHWSTGNVNESFDLGRDILRKFGEPLPERARTSQCLVNHYR